MNIQVIFDSSAADPQLNTGWGLSWLIDGKILFDTGEKGVWLVKNLQVLGININTIEGVVISHDHWDHWGGLWDLLAYKNGLTVYICPHFSPEFKDKAASLGANLVELTDVTEIIPGIFSTGAIAGFYKGVYMPEQAMVIKTINGVSVLTGCAHPGIDTMLARIQKEFPGTPVYAVMGGFHLKDADLAAVQAVADSFKQAGVIKAGPTHCSGDRTEAVFKKHYGDNYIPIAVGQMIEV